MVRPTIGFPFSINEKILSVQKKRLYYEMGNIYFIDCAHKRFPNFGYKDLCRSGQSIAYKNDH